MARSFRETFGAGKITIGVVHLPPLPGSPGFSGDFAAVTERAISEAGLIAKAGFDALIVENYGDLPFHKQSVGPQTVASMAVIVNEIKKTAALPIGVNVLRNDALAALAVSATCGCEFVRVNILVGAYVTAEGVIEGNPGKVLRRRREIAQDTMIFADVMVKHAYRLGAIAVGDDALDAAERGKADCLIITGPRTGKPPSSEDLGDIKASLEKAGREIPIVVGSGVTRSNAENFLKLSDGLIVGSYIRKEGRAGGDIDFEKALEIVRIKEKVRD